MQQTGWDREYSAGIYVGGPYASGTFSALIKVSHKFVLYDPYICIMPHVIIVK